MKTFILIALSLLLLHGFASASEDTDCIWIKFSDGSSCYVLLNSNPEITFDAGRVLVGDKSILLDDVVKYTFGNSSDKAIEIITDENGFKIADGCLWLPSNSDCKEILLSNIQGINYPVLIQKNSIGLAYFDISTLNPDIYILVLGETIIKFVIR